jgi:hypothetical protein
LEKKKKKDKKAKMVKLQQFESLGGLKVTFETLKVKVQMS